MDGYILLAIIFFWLFWIHIPAKMAIKRGRSGLGWVFSLYWEIINKSIYIYCSATS